MPALWKPLVVCIEMNIIYCDVLKLIILYTDASSLFEGRGRLSRGCSLIKYQ